MPIRRLRGSTRSTSAPAAASSAKSTLSSRSRPASGRSSAGSGTRAAMSRQSAGSVRPPGPSPSRSRPEYAVVLSDTSIAMMTSWPRVARAPAWPRSSSSGSRLSDFHAAVLAFAAGVPFFVAPYDRKCIDFAREVALPEAALFPIVGPELWRADAIVQTLHSTDKLLPGLSLADARDRAWHGLHLVRPADDATV